MNESVPESTVEKSSVAGGTELSRPSIRWGGAKWIIAIFACLLLLVWVGCKIADDDTLYGVLLTVSCLLGALALAVWWIAFSRAPWKPRLGVIVVVVAFASMFEIQGFSGGFFPTLVFRWKQAIVAERPAASVSHSGNDEVLLAADYQPVESDWPEYRGTERDGVVRGATYSESWNDPELVWRIPIGDGWSSFCVVGELAYTQWQEDDLEITVCLQAATGVEVWRLANKTRFDESLGGPGPRATPTYSNGRLFVLGATGILNCLDPNSGEAFWSVNILNDANARNIQWAMSGSPLVLGDRVIVSPGGTNNASLVAYDATTGERVWSAGRAIASYSSPQLSVVGGKQQILIFNGVGIHSHDPANGELLWNHEFTTKPRICVAQPGIVGDSSILLSLGYGVGSLLLDVQENEGAWSTTERWKSRRLKSKFNDFVIHGGHAYGLDEGILTCIDLQTGDRAWKGMRCGYGQLILVGETLVILSESGEVIFAKAEPTELVELGRFKAIDGKTWNHPVVANGRLFVRNSSTAACFDLSGN